MKKWVRGPSYQKSIHIEGGGEIVLREIERKVLVKDRIRVRLRYPKEDGRPGTYDGLNWPDALRKAEEFKKDLEEGRDARSKSPTLARVWREWDAMRDEEGLAPSTRKEDGRIRAAVLAEFGTKRIDAIRPIELEQWCKRLAKSKPSSAHKAKSRLGKLFLFAKRKGYLKYNPIIEDPIQLKKPECDKPWVPSWDLMDRVIATGEGQRPTSLRGYPRTAWANVKAAIALGAGAGLRISEVLGIEWQDVDFANRVLHVQRAVTFSGLPKFGKTREVPMTQLVFDALVEHMHMLQQLRIKIEGAVIYNRLNPGRPCDAPNWNDNLKRFLVHGEVIQSADDRAKWHFHVLRRFYISARFALGHNEVAIREHVAHASLDVTFRHYARALPEPPTIWRYRFRPAEPDDRTKVMDGTGAVDIVDGVAQLQAPAIDGSEDAPGWAIEARQLLEGGWKFGEVTAHVRKSRSQVLRTFKAAGWPTPIEVYRVALHKRFEKLYYDEGIPPCDVATQTGVSQLTFYEWRRIHEAGLPKTRKALKQLRKSGRQDDPVVTGRGQKQLRLI